MATPVPEKKYSHQIALVSAPWPVFSRPSIQLGVLKAYLKNALPELDVASHHFFLSLARAIGYPVYQALSRNTWPAESVYAALLYPEREARISAFFRKQAKQHTALAQIDFSELVQKVKTATDAFIRQTHWQSLDLAGFSVCLCQLTASLYFIQKIRQTAPDLPLIAGGAIIGGHTAGDLLAAFPEIDLMVTGEGELPLTRIMRYLKHQGQVRSMPSGGGIVSRTPATDPDANEFSQLPDLKGLPAPDFSDYFRLLAGFPPENQFFPTLPLEASRGCWWRSAGTGPNRQNRPSGCAFCNLNLQWQGYRTKSARQVIHEVTALSEKHKVLSVAFMDNVLPPKQSSEIFTALGATGKDFHFFGELRAATPYTMLETLAAAGVEEVQIGIEALSSRLLKKLNKGTTAMDNMEIMKHCEALGIQNTANLILHFPGSDAADVEETLRAIGFARFFRPPQTVRFWLGMGSPVWENPRDFGLTAICNHPHHKTLFPEPICRQVRFMSQNYRGDKQKQKTLWQPVIHAVTSWQADYRKLHAEPYSDPILTLHDGGAFLILRERRITGAPATHRLEGTSRKIYLFCTCQQRFETIKDRFAPLAAAKIRSFLKLMTDKGLMFEAGDVYLSLAVPARQYAQPSVPGYTTC